MLEESGWGKFNFRIFMCFNILVLSICIGNVYECDSLLLTCQCRCAQVQVCVGAMCVFCACVCVCMCACVRLSEFYLVIVITL